MSRSITTTISIEPSAGATGSGIDLGALAAARRHDRLRRRIMITACQLAVFIAFIGGWQILAGKPGRGLTLIDEYFVSQPSQIWQALLDWAAQGLLLSNALVTLEEVVFGFLIGASIGCIVGLFVGSNATIAAIFQPFITALYSVPRLALVPLFLAWFGFGISSRLAFISVVVFFLVFINTVNGASDVDEELVHVVKVMGGTRRHLFFKVVFPSALTWIAAGLRISVPYALVAAVTAEMMASNQGLGALLIRSSQQFYMAGVFASIVAMVLIALALSACVVLLERRLLRWKPSGHSSGI